MATMDLIRCKKQFIEGYLANQPIAQREVVWLLNYLIANEELLATIHLTDQVHYCPRSLHIQPIDEDTTSFVFKKGRVHTSKADKAFHDIRMNQQEPLFIQLDFKGKEIYPLYLAAYEDNPYSPEAVIHEVAARELAEDFISSSTEEMILDAIDQALDRGNQKLFIQLTEKLRIVQLEGI